MGSPNPNQETPPICSGSSANTVCKPTQLKPVQISCVGPTQEIWQTEQERGKPRQHKTQDVHSVSKARLAPLLPTTAINNDRGTFTETTG